MYDVIIFDIATSTIETLSITSAFGRWAHAIGGVIVLAMGTCEFHIFDPITRTFSPGYFGLNGKLALSKTSDGKYELWSYNAPTLLCTEINPTSDVYTILTDTGSDTFVPLMNNCLTAVGKVISGNHADVESYSVVNGVATRIC